MNEQLVKWLFPHSFLFSIGTFFKMHIFGMGGHPRRYFDPTLYNYLLHLQPLNVFMSVCALCLGASQLIFVVNFFYSLFRGKVAGRNPWHSNSLEWTAHSPPPHGNFVELPIVRRGPYEYANPALEDDYLPQTEPQPAGVPVAAPTH
jgi:cytochrome c oxidase subunit 1